jgi:hypothetical protein
VIPFLLILGALYWLAAPDPVTAGARTASGTAARAAGTGARSHWAAGRGQRQARRTKRRDRWWKAGGVRRAALRAEHAGVWSWGAGKTAAGVTAAAVRPVPSAVKDGWNRGQDRHRAKAGNRPAPVALDLPWWHREQPQVQPEEQDTGTAQEQGPEQVQVQPGNSPEVQPPHPSGLSPEQRCQWCDDRAVTTKRGKLEVCDPCGGEIDGQVSQAIRDHHVTDLPGIGGDHEPDRYTATTRRLPDGSYRGELFYSGLPEEGDQPLVTVDRPTEAEVRHELADVASGIQDDDAHGVPARIAWVPLGENGEPPSPYGEPLNCPPVPADGSTDGAPAPDTTTPTTPTTEGDPMAVNMPSEINDLTTLHSFAQAVIDDAEENGPGSSYAQAAASLTEYFGRDFGREVGGTATAFEESAAAFNQAWLAMVEAAEAMKNESLATIGG